MEREARILQQRVEAHAFGRHRKHPLERIGGEQDEQQEADADHRLHGEHARLERAVVGRPNGQPYPNRPVM